MVRDVLFLIKKKWGIKWTLISMFDWCLNDA